MIFDWLTVRMRMCNYGKLEHTQTKYLWFSISLHIHKTDSEVKTRIHLSAYSTTPSARSIFIFQVIMELLLQSLHV